MAETLSSGSTSSAMQMVKELFGVNSAPTVEDVSTDEQPAVVPPDQLVDNIDDTLSDSDLKKIIEDFAIYDRTTAPPPSAADIYAAKMTGRVTYYDPIDDYNSRLSSASVGRRDYSCNDYESSVNDQMTEITDSIDRIGRNIADMANGAATIEETLTATNILLDEIVKTQTVKNNLFETKLSSLEETQRTILERLADMAARIESISVDIMKL